MKNNNLTPKNIPDLLPTLSDAAVKTNDALNDDKEKRSFISKGEKLHKWVTYLSVDWVFNATVGVAFAYWGKFTKSGQRIWSNSINKGFETVLKPIIKDEKSLVSSVEKGNIFMSIIAGGMFTIPPLMILENNKVKKSIIKKYDEWIYGKDTVANDPKFEQAYAEIHQAPKKDFATGMTSRFAALAPLLAIVLYPKTRDITNKAYFSHIGNATETAAKSIGFSEQSFKGVTSAEAKSRWKFIHDSAAMDLGFGLPYAGLHAFFYNMFASKKAKKDPPVNAETQESLTILKDEEALDLVNAAGQKVKRTILPPTDASHAAREIGRRAENAEIASTQAVL